MKSFLKNLSFTMSDSILMALKHPELFFLLVLTMGVGLILATATTFFTDIKYLYGVLVMLLSFMTPLFYPIDIIPQQFLFAYKLNPLYSAVECFRNIILGGTFPDTWPFVFLIVTSIISLIIGVYVFFKYQEICT